MANELVDITSALRNCKSVRGYKLDKARRTEVGIVSCANRAKYHYRPGNN